MNIFNMTDEDIKERFIAQDKTIDYKNIVEHAMIDCLERSLNFGNDWADWYELLGLLREFVMSFTIIDKRVNEIKQNIKK